ncbi:polysaccharide biosynthesis C-terminal domain-containing protein [Vibrio vulnificus]|uniref:murein biosynthesis integral membrane protein MurJ n=1 Tax=Vibrio vulnificus TaxID=672 RepID=UPI001EEC3192|nr:lipid II flippase MurJ [Vibrio vulnificus]EJV9414805.1 polysaccharide biosynthesis C-terminal domain-containing protein [Vibrio vulnificus]MCG6296255.1 polysaccharide biosynthesis C-terminal domain-containing protein [Vibrio vulnificus]MCU8396703.1 polysaccharide biosynthesis C-terminal domain-containing protein [Vibrio vulnificus]
MSKNVTMVLFYGVICKFFVFFKDLILAATFGTMGYVDLLLMTQAMVGLPVMVISTMLTASFIPKFLDIKNNKGDNEAEIFFYGIAVKTLIFSVILSIFLLLVDDLYIQLFASGYNQEKKEALKMMFQLSLSGVSITLVYNVLLLRMQAVNEFKVSSFSNIPQTIAVIFIILFSNQIGGKYLALINVIGPLVSLLFLGTFYVYRYNSTFRITKNILTLSDNEKAIIKLSLPLLISSFLNQLNLIVDRNLASGLDEGMLAALGYSIKICAILSSIILPLLVVFLPSFSSKSGENKLIEIRKEVNKILSTSIYLLLPIILFVCLNVTELVELLFQRGEFSEEDTITTSMLTIPYLFSVVLFQFINGILIRAFFSINKIKETIIVNASIVLLNIALCVTLTPIIGVYGIAISSAISGFFGFALYFYYYSKIFKFKLTYKIAKDSIPFVASISICFSLITLINKIFVIGFGAFMVIILNLTLAFAFIYLLVMILNVKFYKKLAFDIISRVKSFLI